MSYAYNKRKDLIRRCKKEFGKKEWYPKFREMVRHIVRDREGSPISLEKIMETNNGKV